MNKSNSIYGRRTGSDKSNTLVYRKTSAPPPHSNSGDYIEYMLSNMGNRSARRLFETGDNPLASLEKEE